MIYICFCLFRLLFISSLFVQHVFWGCYKQYWCSSDTSKGRKVWNLSSLMSGVIHRWHLLVVAFRGGGQEGPFCHFSCGTGHWTQGLKHARPDALHLCPWLSLHLKAWDSLSKWPKLSLSLLCSSSRPWTWGPLSLFSAWLRLECRSAIS